MTNKDFAKEVKIQQMTTIGSLMTIKATLKTLKDGTQKDECIMCCEKLRGVLEENLDHLQFLSMLLIADQMMEGKEFDPVDFPLPFMPKGSVAIDVNELLRQLGKEDKGNDSSNS